MAVKERVIGSIRRRKSLKIILILGGPLALFAIFFMVPFLISLMYSIGVPRQLPTAEYYARAVNPLYLKVLARSLVLGTATTLSCLVLGYPIAYFIALKAQRLKNFMVIVIIVPYWVSFLLRAYALMTILDPRGILNSLLLRIGLIENPLPLLYNTQIVALAMLYAYMPFAILPLYASLEKLNVNLLEAARALGASPARTFLHVTLPLSKPGLAAAWLLTFIPATGEYVIPALLGGTGDYYVGQLIWDSFLSMRDWYFGSAISAFYLTIVMVGVILYLKYVGEEVRI